MQSLTPGQQVIKIVNEELTKLMGDKETKINFASSPPTVILMCGLQGLVKQLLQLNWPIILRNKIKGLY